MSLAIHDFESTRLADTALAAKIGPVLQAAIQTRGRASLGVCGGATPRNLYLRLSMLDLDWSRISIIPTDERWVHPDEAGSNETFIRSSLLQNHAANADFLSLKTDHSTASEAAQPVSQLLAAGRLPFDVVVLGMGNDGHTLSWFPHAEGLATALRKDGPLAAALNARVSEVTGPLTERISLTRAALTQATFLALLLHGDEKMRVLKRACEAGPVGDMPIRALIRDPALELEVYLGRD